MICVQGSDGKLLPITAKPYNELLEHLQMTAEEYVRAVGSLIKNKVVSSIRENRSED